MRRCVDITPELMLEILKGLGAPELGPRRFKVVENPVPADACEVELEATDYSFRIWFSTDEQGEECLHPILKTVFEEPINEPVFKVNCELLDPVVTPGLFTITTDDQCQK